MITGVYMTTERLRLETDFVELDLKTFPEAHVRLACLLRRLAKLPKAHGELVEKRAHLRGVLFGERLGFAFESSRSKRRELGAQPFHAPVRRADLGSCRGNCAAHQGIDYHRRHKRRANANQYRRYHRQTILLTLDIIPKREPDCAD